MTVSAEGVLAVWHDMAPEREAEINAWYDREHHAERVDIPGFLDARRHIALCGRPRYFVRYRTRTPEVLASPAYRACVEHPTPRTRLAMTGYRDMCRNVCRVARRFGRAEGGVVATVRFLQEHQAAWPADKIESVLASAVERPGVVAAEFWHVIPELTLIGSRERLLRGAADALTDRIAAIHATGEAALADAAAWFASSGVAGAEAPAFGLYRAMFTLHVDA